MLHLFKYIKKSDWLLIIVAVFFIVLQVYLELKMPDYTRELSIIVETETASMPIVLKNGGLMLLCAVASMLSSIICAIIIARVASGFAFNIRQALFKKITGFSHNEINIFSVPSLITRTTNDVLQMQMFIAIGMQMLIKAPIMAVWAIIKISSTNVSWTLAVIISVAVIVVCVGLLISITLPKFKQIQKLTDQLNSATRENISGVRVVRAFNAEEYQEKKFEQVNSKITKTRLFTSKAMGLLSPVMTLCLNGLTLAIYWVGAILINNIKLSSYAGDVYAFSLAKANLIGDMAAFTQYSMQVVMAFMMLIMVFVILPRIIVSGNRIYDVIKTKNSIIGAASSPKTQTSGQIEFKNVGFSYSGGNEIISNISFKINKGETVAIIGATGSGKSTIINLIPRFYDVTSGQILFNGKDIKEYNLHDLRNKISLVPQTAKLFKGSVKQNIIYGSAYDEARFKKAVKISQSNFINKLKNGAESMVAQGGTNFSGGQKQRLCIARAIYKPAEIIIFDDSFSALDYKTDMLVRKGINEYLDDTTIIIVAQRIGTIMHADKIIVLDEGKIVGMGTHDELLNTCKVYKEIALSQLKEEEL